MWECFASRSIQLAKEGPHRLPNEGPLVLLAWRDISQAGLDKTKREHGMCEEWLRSLPQAAPPTDRMFLPRNERPARVSLPLLMPRRLMKPCRHTAWPPKCHWRRRFRCRRDVAEDFVWLLLSVFSGPEAVSHESVLASCCIDHSNASCCGFCKDQKASHPFFASCMETAARQLLPAQEQVGVRSSLWMRLVRPVFAEHIPS